MCFATAAKELNWFNVIFTLFAAHGLNSSALFELSTPFAPQSSDGESIFPSGSRSGVMTSLPPGRTTEFIAVPVRTDYALPCPYLVSYLERREGSWFSN